MEGLVPRNGYGIFTNMLDNLQDNEVGLRLRAERKRLGLTQSQLGARGGVSLSSQHAYESGIHRPDTRYLALVAETGIDMQYVVLGQKTEPRSPSNVDWKAMEEIGLLIEQSAMEHGGHMSLALKFHFQRAFYEQYLANRQLDLANYSVTLKLVGNSRAP